MIDNIQHSFPVLLIAFVLLFISSCTSESVIHVWNTSEEYQNPFTKIMVIGLVNNPGLRSELENEFVMTSKNFSIEMSNGMSMFPPELGKPLEDIERVKERLRKNGFDCILTVTYIDINASRYISPNTSYEPQVYYDRFRNYYYQTYDLVYRPGYFFSSTSFYIESNLYDLKDGALVWSGLSKAFETSEKDYFINQYSNAIFESLGDQGVILIK